MSLLKDWARVRKAQLRMATVRRQASEPASALLARAHEYPLTAMGIAAGSGFALGSLDVHPLRVPGMTSLLGSGLGAAITHGSQWLAELAALGLVAGHTSNANSATSGVSEDERP
ncbi:MAG: hypothetical protein ABI389_12840 [Rhodanobacter sp.]